MVLINNLTIDEINAALLHLQRSQGEIVGGTKGNTINNISVTQQGGGGYTPDFSSAIKNLEKRVDTLDVKTEQNQQNIAGQSKINVTQKDQISDLYNLVNNLRSSQIIELFFDEDTRVLTLATTDARYDVPLPSEEVSLTFDSTSNKLVFSMGEQTKEVTLPYINASEKGVANGVATLDATGRVPYSQLPESAMEFKGEWNADTNTPELKDGHGTNGDFYICNVGGTANFGTSQNPRTITFYVNDRVIYQGNVAQWKRLPASEVRTVNGQSGDVTLNGTNVNYSDANNSPTLKDKIDSVETKAETQSDWSQSDNTKIDFIKNKPSLATVATSGSYNDLSNKPTIPAAQIQSNWTQTDSTKKDFIKNKIPIWITSGSADDNMSPIDSVTDGSMRPVTSNAVYNLTSTGTDSSKTDANLCYAESTRVAFFRLGIGSSNCPPSNDTNPTYIEAFTFNDGTNIRVTQMAYDNFNGNASYMRSGYKNASDTNIIWTSWEKLTTPTDLISCQRQRSIEVYSSNTWSSGYWNILTVSSYAVTGNHDVAVSGIFSHKVIAGFGYPRKFFFQIAVRGQNTNISFANFTMLKLSGSLSNFGLIATRKVVGTRFIINLYIPITEYWTRDTIKVTDLMVGNVYPTTPLIDGAYSGNLTLQDTHVASIPTDETQITLTNLN